MIVLIAFMGAVNYQLFVFPNQFAPAGLNGICTMIQHISGISVGYLSLLINIPLAFAVFFKVSRPLALRSMVYVSVFFVALVVLFGSLTSSFGGLPDTRRAISTTSSCFSFVPAKWLTLPVFALGLCRLWQDIAKAWFAWEGKAADVMTAVITWASFATILAFHFAMLYGIRVLALEVGLGKLSSHAMYNTLAVGVWGVLFLLCNMPAIGESLLPYLSVSMALFNLVYLISNIVLLVRCSKNICAEGDEEVAPKPSRFAWLNRINESYNQMWDKYRANSHADGAAIRQKYIEKKNKRKKKK